MVTIKFWRKYKISDKDFPMLLPVELEKRSGRMRFEDFDLFKEIYWDSSLKMLILSRTNTSSVNEE